MLGICTQKCFLTILLVFFTLIFTLRASAMIHIAAAENIYGEVAQELGGPHVQVISIINSPTQDPHLFTVSPSIAKAIILANIVIYNGADYDPWMNSMLAIENKEPRIIINVAELIHVKPGANPHIWYSPSTMPIFATTLVNKLIELDPHHQQYYQNQLNHFMQSYQVILDTVRKLKIRYQNTPVIATEPVFGYMANSIGLIMHSEGYQISTMNDIPPTITQIREFEDALQQHSVRLLIYNTQVINPLSERMKNLAIMEKIPILGVSEMIPPQMTYIQWIKNELNDLEMQLEKND
jgi:zinc/manganese transport system substrate-binding protein